MQNNDIQQMTHRMGVAWARLSAKTPRQLWRYCFTRIWPLSILGGYFYTIIFSQKWHQHTNQEAQQAHTGSRVVLSSTESRLLSTLNSCGIFVDRDHTLFSTEQIENLVSSLDRFWTNPRIAFQLDNRKSIDGSKWYVIRAFGKKPPPLSREIQGILFNEALLNIIGGYLGAWPKLRYVDLWHNLAADTDELPIDSEYWHRDSEDLHVVTLFLYLDDVGKDQGPFSYIKKSQRGGKYGHIAPAHPPLGSYPCSDVIFERIPVGNIVHCPGPQGTVVLCDTSGLHRGGRVNRGKRLLLTARYFSCAGIDRIDYITESPISADLDPRVRFLLS